MSSLVEEAKFQIESLIEAASASAYVKGKLPSGAEIRPEGTVQISKNPAYGDFSCSYAMIVAKIMKKPPQVIADAICGELVFTGSFFSGAETKNDSEAGKGFINFRLSDKWYAAVLAEIERESTGYGCPTERNGQKIVIVSIISSIDFLNVDTARGCIIGDILANVYERSGYTVTREICMGGNIGERQICMVLDALKRCRINYDICVSKPKDCLYDGYVSELTYIKNLFAKRNFDNAVIVIEADCSERIRHIKTDLSALGIEADRFEAVFYRPVRIIRSAGTAGEIVKSGKNEDFISLLDEVPTDAVRYYLGARPDTVLRFDTDTAVRVDGSNPAYYVQYTHARLCSLTKPYSTQPVAEAASFLLNSENEKELIKLLAAFPEEIRLAMRSHYTSGINRYLIRLSSQFRSVNTAGWLKAENSEVFKSRLILADSVRRVLANGLDVLGMTSPKKI